MNKLLFGCILLIVVLYCSCLSFDSNPYKQGKNLYETNCQNCHQADGQALAGLIPPLAGSDYLVKNKDQLACIIRHGLEGEILVNGVTYNQPMPANNLLTEIQIANIINYINNEWGNKNGYTSYEDVIEKLKNCNVE
ncbi:MAG: cytochrome c [Bacteroidota bacterium]